MLAGAEGMATPKATTPSEKIAHQIGALGRKFRILIKYSVNAKAQDIANNAKLDRNTFQSVNAVKPSKNEANREMTYF